MRYVVALIALLVFSAPAWASTCKEDLTKAIADQDVARIDAITRDPPRERDFQRRLFLHYRELIELDTGYIIVLKRQIKAIEEIEERLKVISDREGQVLVQMKARLAQRIVDLDAGVLQYGLSMQRGIHTACVAYDEYMAGMKMKPKEGDQTKTIGTKPPPPVDRRPPKDRYGTSAVLEMDGEPKPQPKVGDFKVVEAGKIYLENPNYKVTATWDELPQSLEPQGKTIKLTITAWAKTSINSGIQIRGGNLAVTRLIVAAKTPDEEKKERESWGSQPLDLPASAEKDGSVTREMIVHIKPSPLYNKADKAWISVGVFYGVKVDYNYKVLNTGEN